MEPVSTSSNKIVKTVITIIVVLAIAAFVFYFKDFKSGDSAFSKSGDNSTLNQDGDKGPNGDKGPEVIENVDPSAIEADLDLASKNMETIDNLDNF